MLALWIASIFIAGFIHSSLAGESCFCGSSSCEQYCCRPNNYEFFRYCCSDPTLSINYKDYTGVYIGCSIGAAVISVIILIVILIRCGFICTATSGIRRRGTALAHSTNEVAQPTAITVISPQPPPYTQVNPGYLHEDQTMVYNTPGDNAPPYSGLRY